MSIFYTFPYKNSADDFSPTLFIIEPKKTQLWLFIAAAFFLCEILLKVFANYFSYNIIYKT